MRRDGPLLAGAGAPRSAPPRGAGHRDPARGCPLHHPGHARRRGRSDRRSACRTRAWRRGYPETHRRCGARPAWLVDAAAGAATDGGAARARRRSCQRGAGRRRHRQDLRARSLPRGDGTDRLARRRSGEHAAGRCGARRGGHCGDQRRCHPARGKTPSRARARTADRANRRRGRHRQHLGHPRAASGD